MVHETFRRRNCMLGHETNVNKFKKLEITRSIFFDHNGMKSESIAQKKSQEFHEYVLIKPHAS